MKNNILGKKILILGGGTWLVPHIKKANELGLKTFVTDWSNNAEGKEFAHVFEQIDLKDKVRTLSFAIKHKVDAIYTSADIGVQTAAYVASKLGLKYHSIDLAFCSTNKRAMRAKAKKIGLNIPNYYSTNNLNEAKSKAKEFGYPVIIKPVDNFSSRGVSVLYNEDDLNSFFEESLSASFEGNILIEEFMIGAEGSVEALINNGKVHIMGICDKVKSELPYRYDLQLNYPGNFSTLQIKLIHDFITDLVSGFEINDGIIHVEIMVKDETIKLIEFAIRGCGSKVITDLMPSMLNFDVLKYLILNSFDYDQEISFNRIKKYGVLKFMMFEPGIVDSIEGIEKVREIDNVLDFDIELTKGDIIGQIKDGRSRPGYLLAVSTTKNELKKTIDKVMDGFIVKYKTI